jgi:hypothetical protein
MERILEIRDSQGRMLFSLRITEARENHLKDERPQSDQRADGQMSDAQKRYLFRILAEKGMEGEVAHEHLKRLFGVASLKEVTKEEASTKIDDLLRS